jgi:hypothetical protein
MRTGTSRRWLVWGGLGVFTLLAAIDVTVKDHPAKTARIAEPAGRRMGEMPGLSLGGLLHRERLSSDVRGEPFASGSWSLPLAPQPAAKPSVPPFDYSYAGRMQIAGEAVRYYLSRDGEVFRVKVGDVLDGVYKVDALDGDRIELTLVPEGRRVSMTLSGLEDKSKIRVATSDRAAESGATKAPAAMLAPAGPIAQAAPQISEGSTESVLAAMGRAAGRADNGGIGPGNTLNMAVEPLGDSTPGSGSMPTDANPGGGASMPLGMPPAAGSMPILPAPTRRLGS